MAFTPLKNYEGKEQLLGVATTQTVVKGDLLFDNGSGYLATMSSGDNTDPQAVAMETVTTTSNGQLVRVLPIDRSIYFEADTDAAVAQTDVGTYADLASKSTIDPDASADDLFEIMEIVGTAGTATKVRGRFVGGVPNS